MADSDLHQTWRRRTDLAEVDSDGRAAILRLARLDLPPLILEGTAAIIWSLIDGPITLDDLVPRVAAEFDAPADDVLDIVDGFLTQLVDADLVVKNAEASVSLTALGLDVVVHVAGAQGGLLAEALREAWSACLSGTEGGGLEGPIEVQAQLDEADALGEVMQWVTQEVTARAIEHLAGRALLLHACAIAHPGSGASVVLVGPSGMGKTTVASVLGTRWGYVTDETAAIDSDKFLLPYPKPLSVVEDAESPKTQRSPHDLGLLDAPSHLRVAAVVLLDRRRDDKASETGLEVTTVPTVDGVALLAEHTSYLDTIDRPMNALAELLTSTGGLRHVRYTHTEELIPLVAELLAAPGAES